MDLVKPYEHSTYKKIKNCQIECEIKLNQIKNALLMLDHLAEYTLENSISEDEYTDVIERKIELI